MSKIITIAREYGSGGRIIARMFYSWSGAEFKFCSFFHDFFVKFCVF